MGVPELPGAAEAVELLAAVAETVEVVALGDRKGDADAPFGVARRQPGIAQQGLASGAGKGEAQRRRGDGDRKVLGGEGGGLARPHIGAAAGPSLLRQVAETAAGTEAHVQDPRLAGLNGQRPSLRRVAETVLLAVLKHRLIDELHQ